MKILILFLVLTASLALAETPSPAPVVAAPAAPTPDKGKIYVNGFRGPSIGLEYQKGIWSWHAGFYPTVLSMDDAREGKTTWFTRGGLTWWPTSWAFIDASTLMGLNLDYRREISYMLNPGVQYTFYDLALRFGVAMLAAPGHDLKINPTPGIGLVFSI